jgi:hypothetical protein
MDRAPLPAPFPIGTRLRYVGAHHSWTIDSTGARVPICEPGLEVTIDRIMKGRRGTLRPIPEGDGSGPMLDEEGEPVLDRTSDDCSVYRYRVDDVPFGRLVRAEHAHEWEVLG